MQRRLQEVRQQKPDADYATIAGDFETILERADRPARADRLCRQVRLSICRSGWSMPKSRRSRAPRASTASSASRPIRQFLAQQRLTDARGAADHRRRAAAAAAADAGRDQCAGVGRDGDALCVDDARIARGRGRRDPAGRVQGRAQPDGRRPPAILRGQPQPLHVPEQRVLRIATDRSRAGRRASPHPTRKSPAYYNANKATYGAKETRDAQPGGRARPGDGERDRGEGQGRRDACCRRGARRGKPRSHRSRTRPAQAYAGVAGDKAAAAVFGAPPGAVVGPVQSDFGWVVAKVEFGQDRAAASRSPRRAPKSPPSSTPTSASRRSRTWSTRSRTRSTKAAISPKPRPRPRCR